MKAAKEVDVIVSDKLGASLRKKSRYIIVANVKEGYKHHCLLIPSLGDEWKYFATTGLKKLASEIEGGALVIWQDPDETLPTTLTEIPFTKEVYIFTDNVTGSQSEIVTAFKVRGWSARIFDDVRWQKMWNARRPDFFIAHDSRDKELFPRQLYHALAQRQFKVWYDEYSLTVGDDLAGAIDHGLTQCCHAVLVVTKHLLENKGWASKEISALLNRAISNPEQRLILPVWLGVTKKDVEERSALLANTYALDGSEGVDAVAGKLIQARQKSTQN